MNMFFFNQRTNSSANPTPTKPRDSVFSEAYSESALAALAHGFDFNPEETQIVRFVAGAVPLGDIASEMNMSVPEVKSYMRSICSKTGTRNAGAAKDLVTRVIS